MPDVDKNTIRAIISSSSPKNKFNADLLTSLFVNGNYNDNSTAPQEHTASSTLLGDIFTLMGEFGNFSEEHLAEMAGAVSVSISETFTPDDILFPSRTARWNWPVSLASGMYELAINKRLANVGTGRQVHHNGGVWASANSAFLGRLLMPLFDRVVSSGAWAAYGARKMMDDIVNTVLTKVMDNHDALALDSSSVSVIGKLSITWYIVENAARNRGVCSLVYDATSTNNHYVTSIDKRNEFFIEPGTTLANHRMSEIPARLLSIADNSAPASAFTESLTFEREVKNVVFNIKTADQFFENSDEVRIIVTEPDEEKNSASDTTTTMVYEAPRILIYDDERVSNPPEGFKSLRESNFLTSTLVAKSGAHRKFTGASGPAGVTIERSQTNVNHVSSTLPGFSSTNTTPDQTPMTSMCEIEDNSTKATFWDPLISQLALSNASICKDRPEVSMDKLMLLETGEIVIQPSRTSSSSLSLSDKAFAWLWERMPQTPYLPLTDEKRKRRVSQHKLSVIEKFIGRFARSSRQAAVKPSTVAKQPPPPLHFSEVDTFLKYDFSHVVVTMLSRLAIIINPTELSYIKKISESVASVMSDSFHIALDPNKKMYEIMDRIASQTNGLIMDESGVIKTTVQHQWFEQQQQQSSASGGGEDTLSSKRIDAILTSLRGSSRDRRNLVAGDGDPAVNFTGRLLSMVGDRRKCGSKTESAAPADQRIPSFFFSVMPPPRNRLSQLTTSGQPLSRSNFTHGHFLYVPVNPRYILTDVQWVETLAAVEMGTRHLIEAYSQFDKQECDATKEIRDLLKRWSRKIKTTRNFLSSGNEPSVALIIDSFDREARRLVSVRDRACNNKQVIQSKGSTIAIEKFGLIAVARSLFDIDFYYKMNNNWPQMDWRGIIETAVGMAIVPLKENIARGILAASRILVNYQAKEALGTANTILQQLAL